ncbi:hypothetical protein HK099_001530 [Clydaea vesicula]|uniref:Uncharacterized protein n=1 Tax=Clydaea vesicula TaxID=447962 RepID=A0AAD5TTV0_9FUNG|nr:hypothetical protein HK099_001530 [Clydaea vesicula]
MQSTSQVHSTSQEDSSKDMKAKVLGKFKIWKQELQVEFYDFNPDHRLQFLRSDDAVEEGKIVSVKERTISGWDYGIISFKLKLKLYCAIMEMIANLLDLVLDNYADEGTIEYDKQQKNIAMFIDVNGIQCYKSAIRVLEECWKSAGRMLEECWKNAGRVLEECWKSAGRVLEGAADGCRIRTKVRYKVKTRAQNIWRQSTSKDSELKWYDNLFMLVFEHYILFVTYKLNLDHLKNQTHELKTPNFRPEQKEMNPNIDLNIITARIKNKEKIPIVIKKLYKKQKFSTPGFIYIYFELETGVFKIGRTKVKVGVDKRIRQHKQKCRNSLQFIGKYYTKNHEHTELIIHQELKSKWKLDKS